VTSWRKILISSLPLSFGSLGIVRQLYAEPQQSLHSHMAPFRLQGKAGLVHEPVPSICQATWLECDNPAGMGLIQQNIFRHHAH
jgi:hypothetical protein